MSKKPDIIKLKGAVKQLHLSPPPPEGPHPGERNWPGVLVSIEDILPKHDKGKPPKVK